MRVERREVDEEAAWSLERVARSGRVVSSIPPVGEGESASSALKQSARAVQLGKEEGEEGGAHSWTRPSQPSSTTHPTTTALPLPPLRPFHTAASGCPPPVTRQLPRAHDAAVWCSLAGTEIETSPGRRKSLTSGVCGTAKDDRCAM